jgi:hypothetical protein
MQLRINEQELIDGVCVFVANQMNTDPEEVDVTEITTLDNGMMVAKATCFSRHHTLDTEQILEGVMQFLEEYHKFNRGGMYGSLHFNRNEGYWAEVVVNE